MPRNKYSFLLIAACLTTAGCGWISGRETNPLIEEYLATGWDGTERLVGVLATTASRRTVLVSVSDRDPSGIGVVCAEPPPDVSEAFAKTMAAELSARGIPGGGAGMAEGKAGVATTIATAVGPLLYRSQSLQFLRDQTYMLCLDYFNGIVKSDNEYMETKQQLIHVFEGLLKQEIDHIPTFTPASVSPPPPKSEVHQ
jgi:hypothetical protein